MAPGWISAVAHAVVATFNVYLFVKYVYRDPVTALEKKAEQNRYLALRDRKTSLQSLVLVNAMPSFFESINKLYSISTSSDSAEQKRLTIKSICREIRRSIEEPLRIVHLDDSTKLKQAIDQFTELSIAWLAEGQGDRVGYEEQVSTLYSTIIRVVLEYDGSFNSSPHDWNKTIAS